MDFVSLALKVLCIALYIFNIAPLLSFLTFCLLQQSARNVLSIGGATKHDGFAHKISRWYQSFKQPKQSVYNVADAKAHNEIPSLEQAIFLRFMGIQIKYKTADKLMTYNQYDAEVLGILNPQVPFNHPSNQTATQSQTPKRSGNPSLVKPSLVKLGFDEHFLFMVRQKTYQLDQSPTSKSATFSALEVTFQLGNAFRLKINLNLKLVYALVSWGFILWTLPQNALMLLPSASWSQALLYPLNWYLNQTPAFMLIQALMLVLTLTAICKEDFIMFFIGHDPKSLNSHLMRLDKNGHLVYSLGTILVNLLVNGLFFFALYCCMLTPVNILSLVSQRTLLAVAAVTALDRAYFLAQRYGLLSIPTFSRHTRKVLRGGNQGFEVPAFLSTPIKILHRNAHSACRVGESVSSQALEAA